MSDRVKDRVDPLPVPRRTKMNPESALLRKIVDRLNGLPGAKRVRKLADRFTRGYPDVQAFLSSPVGFVVLEIEVKVPGGKLAAIQDAERRACEKVAAGSDRYVWLVARSVDDVDCALRLMGY